MVLNVMRQEKLGGYDNASFDLQLDGCSKDKQGPIVMEKKNAGNQRPSILGIRLPHSVIGARWLLVCLCIAALIQGMIFTNVVISSLEKRFGLQSTTSGLIAGAYDFGSLIAVIPITYFGGRPGASKPKYIALGMLVVGTGSLIFASPHFVTERYILTFDLNSTSDSSGRINENLCFSSTEETNGSSYSSDTQSLTEDSDLSSYKYVFLLGQLFHGIGSVALITLGNTLLDESVPKSSVPMYIGILNACFVIGPALGYLVGGQFLNVFTEFYLANYANLEIDPTSPKWIGAWWIGFLFILVSSHICAFFIGLFPARLPEPEKSESDKLKNEEFIMNKCDFGKISELPKALYKLMANSTYVLISFGATMDGFLLAALAAFMPKYLESQYGLTPGYAAILMGLLIVPAGAGGTLLGGILVKFYKFTRSQSIAMYICCQITIVPLYFGFLLNCSNTPFAGINVAYSNSTWFSSSPRLTAECNGNCSTNCASLSYQPICGGDGISYYSPCYAGCSLNGTGGIFERCSCIEGGNSSAVEGTCSEECDYLPFALLFFFQVFFTFLATMPGLVASLRSVEPLYRSLSLGLQTILVRGFGTIPGPILFGVILDKSCVLWSDGGSCLLYDNFWSSRLILGVLVVWRIIGIVFFLLAFFKSKKSKLEDS